MNRNFFALALASAAITPAYAQADVIGSGVSPSAAAHSQTRPINFATTAPTSGALVILMRNATLPSNVVDAATAQAVNAAIASAKFEGKEGSSLSLRGIGNYARIILSGVGEEGDHVTHIRNASGKAAQDLRDEVQPVTITGALNQDEAASAALGYAMGQYRFDRYKTVDRKTPPTNPVTIVSSDAGSAEALWKSRHASA